MWLTVRSGKSSKLLHVIQLFFITRSRNVIRRMSPSGVAAAPYWRCSYRAQLARPASFSSEANRPPESVGCTSIGSSTVGVTTTRVLQELLNGDLMNSCVGQLKPSIVSVLQEQHNSCIQLQSTWRHRLMDYSDATVFISSCSINCKHATPVRVLLIEAIRSGVFSIINFAHRRSSGIPRTVPLAAGRLLQR